MLARREGCSMPSIEHARAEQVRCAEEIAANGWNERQAVLGMGDWFAEEFILTHETPCNPRQK